MIDLLKDSAPEVPAPAPRTCATCACAQKMTNPQAVTESHWVCRRDPPFAQDARVRVPDPADRSGKRSIEGIQRTFSHRPTLADAVCFDGWRPLGTLPGDRNWEMEAKVVSMLPKIQAAVEKMVSPPVFLTAPPESN